MIQNSLIVQVVTQKGSSPPMIHEGAVFKESIDNMSLLSAKVVLIVAFRTTPFDCLSVRGHLQPLAKYLEVKVRGIGKYQMAIPLAKELMKQQFVGPRDGVVMINYNHIKRKDYISVLINVKKQNSNVMGKNDVSTPEA